MYHLIIDTCVWIDLGKKYIEVREKISQLVRQDKVILILPQTVLDEWKRHKSKIVEFKKSLIHGKIKNAEDIALLLKPEEASTFKKILDEFEKSEEIKQSAFKEIEAIEALFNHNSTIKFAITEETMSQVIDFGLAKKAPFRNRNGTADALIILGAINYVRQEKLDNCIFISSNIKDFAAPSDKTKINEDLQEFFDECGMRYFSNIGQAINEIETDLVSSESIQEIEETQQWEVIQGVLEDYKQSIERIKASGGISVLHETFAKQNQVWGELVKSIGAVGGISALQETFEKQNQVWGELAKSIGAADGISDLQETFAKQNQVWGELVKSIGAMGGISALQETFEKQNQVWGELAKSIGATDGISDLQETFAKQNQVFREFEKSISAMYGISALQETLANLQSIIGDLYRDKL